MSETAVARPGVYKSCGRGSCTSLSLRRKEWPNLAPQQTQNGNARKGLRHAQAQYLPCLLGFRDGSAQLAGKNVEV